jgi:hypothetical protein
MGCRLNDIAGIAAGVNLVPEAVWPSSLHRQAFRTDNAPPLFQTQGANSISAALDRDKRGSVSN